MVVRFPQFLVGVELDEKISQSGLGLETACFAYYLNASLAAQILLGVVKLD